MELKDKIYFYNPKYPEHGIEELPLVDIKYITSVIDGRDLYIYAVVSTKDIETGENLHYRRQYNIYNPYAEDDDMYMYDLVGNRERILSFNKEKITKWWEEDLRVTKNKLTMRLKDVEECLNQK